MSNSLSSLIENFAKILYNDKYTGCTYCLEYISNKNELLKFNRQECSKSHSKESNKTLIKTFANFVMEIIMTFA